jgi:DNA mismatch repair protein MutS2
MEINLRGRLVEDGIEQLDRYLEQAYAARLPWVRIIHGKGTGRMREAVRAALKDHPYVKSFEEARDSEGGAGVTIARMGNS